MEFRFDWFEKLKNQQLSRQDRQTVRRFLSEPKSRLFLSVAELLKAYDQTADCVALLEYGVKGHPSYGAARVILAREYFEQGRFNDAFEMINGSPVALQQNRLAQKILFKTAMILGFFPEADGALTRMKTLDSKDEETAQAADLIDLHGHAFLRSQLMDRHQPAARADPLAMPLVSTPPLPGLPRVADPRIPPRPPRDSGARTEDLLRKIDLGEFSRYKIAKLADIFSGEVQLEGSSQAEHKDLTLELDSTTLADIFAAQGHYRRALGIYRRLLRLVPANAHVRNRVRELSKLLEDQKAQDYEIDPDTIEKMEQIDGIDRRMQILQEWLDALPK